MQLAQSYLQGQASPFDGVLEAYGQGQILRQNKDLLQSQQAEQARKIAAQQALETIDWNDKGAIARTVAQFPEYTKGAKDYYDALEQKEQQSMLYDMSTSISALSSDRPDIAVQNMRDKATAYRDAGNEEKAEEYSQMAEWMAREPKAAQRALLMHYAVLSPEKSGANLKAYGEAISPQRKEVDSGDAIYNYQIDPVTGEIGGAEWVVDKSATPDNVLDNETSRINTTQTNMVSEGNNIRTNQTSENNNIRSNTVSENNNIRSNTASENNNIRSTNVSRLNAQDANDIKKYGIDINAQNAANILEYRRQQDEITSKQAKLQTFGGQVYVTYPDGTAAPAKDKNGNDIFNNKTNVEAQGKAREETQRIEKLKILIPEIKTLLSNATGSRTGAAIDATARAFGKSTQGNQTTAQLKTLSGQMVSMMPRMEGPQSDKDVEMYKEMAGNIGDPTKTRAERLAALQTIERINSKYETLNRRLNSQSSTQQATSTSNDTKRSALFN